MPRPDLSGIVNNDPNDADPVSIAFKYLLGTYTEDEIFLGKPVAYEPETVEISSGAVTVTKGILLVTGANGNSDNLDTINQPSGDFETGTIIVVTGGGSLTQDFFNEVITVRHDRGNILLATDESFVIGRIGQGLTLRWDGSNWIEVSRSGVTALSRVSSSERTGGTGSTLRLYRPSDITEMIQRHNLDSWTTAGRPSSPRTGQSGFNTTLGYPEYWNEDESEWTPFGTRHHISTSPPASSDGNDGDVWLDY